MNTYSQPFFQIYQKLNGTFSILRLYKYSINFNKTEKINQNFNKKMNSDQVRLYSVKLYIKSEDDTYDIDNCTKTIEELYKHEVFKADIRNYCKRALDESIHIGYRKEVIEYLAGYCCEGMIEIFDDCDLAENIIKLYNMFFPIEKQETEQDFYFDNYKYISILLIIMSMFHIFKIKKYRHFFDDDITIIERMISYSKNFISNYDKNKKRYSSEELFADSHKLAIESYNFLKFLKDDFSADEIEKFEIEKYIDLFEKKDRALPFNKRKRLGLFI
jgi:hypothetical protein